MTKQEFENLTSIPISDLCYKKLIEYDYVSTPLEKAEYCKKWKRSGGLRKMYEFELSRAEDLAQAVFRFVNAESGADRCIALIDLKCLAGIYGFGSSK